ncbi:MAG: flagellar biosynthesis protein FlhF [Bacillota bacterium]
MNIKRYIAKDMMEATRKIREELGPEAVILHNKTIRKKGLRRFFSPPMVEVVVAYEPPTRQNTMVQIPTEAYRTAREKPMDLPYRGPEREQKIRELDGKISDLQAMFGNLNEKPDRPQPVPNEIIPLKPRPYVPAEAPDLSAERLVNSLLEMEVLEDMALSLAAKARRIAKARGEHVAKVMKQVVYEQLGDPQPIRLRKLQRTVVILFGPTGVGKTTSLIKLAAHYSLVKKLKVGLINADTYRLAAHEQLKAYADIIGTPLSIVYTPEEIVPALAEHEDKDIVFIDTTGKKPGDMEHRADIEKMVELSGASEVFLVLAAPTSTRVCKEIIKNYNCLKDYKLLITKTDETDSTATILNASYLSGRPLSYIAIGQNVPDDIQVADVANIVRQTFEEERTCLSRLAN